MFSLSDRYNKKSTLVLLTLAAILVGTIGIALGTLGLITLPITAALLATLYVFEKKKIAYAAATVFLVTLEFLVNLRYSLTFTSLFAAITAFVMALWLQKGYRKSESGLICALLLAIEAFLVLLFAVAALIGTYELDTVFTAMRLSIRSLGEVFTNELAALASIEGMQAYADIFTDEYVEALLDTLVKALPSMLLIIGFLFSGLAHKVFKAFLLKYARQKETVASWRYINSSLLAYAYMIFAVASVFSSSSDSVVAVSIMNLYFFFMLVFAYTGYTFLHEFFEYRTHKAFLATLILIAAILLFSSFAVQILSVVGTFATIAHSKISSAGQDGDALSGENKSGDRR